MERVKELASAQYAQEELMHQLIRNYKKDGPARKTGIYFEKKLTDFQNMWDAFQKSHKEMLVMKYANQVPAEEFDKIPYIDEDIYSNVDEFFSSNYALLEEKSMELRAKPNVEPTDSHHSNQVTNSGKPSGSSLAVKLPKITLEKFAGDYKKWPTFHDLFRTLVHETNSLSDVQKLQYLKLHLIGEPEHLLRHLQVTDQNYESAWELLKERYENERVLVNTHLKVILSQPALSSETTNGIKEMLDNTRESLQALSNRGISVEGWDPLIVYIIVQKLPPETHQMWEQEVSKKKTLPTWRELREFLEVKFRTLEAIATRKFGWKPPKPQIMKPKPFIQQSHQAFHTTPKVVCIVCLGNHSIRQCSKFLNMSSSQRLEIVKAKGLCLNCLGAGHLLMTCPSQHKCFHCKQRHHTLLHRHNGKEETPGMHGNSAEARSQDQIQSHMSSTQTTPSEDVGFSASPNTNAYSINSLNVTKAPSTQILLATALVKVVSPLGQEIFVRALIDQGSQASFITESLVQTLKLKREAISATVHGIGRSVIDNVHARTQLHIKSLSNNTTIHVSALVLKKLAHLLPPVTITSRNWDHISNLTLADPSFYTPGKIDLLLGAEVYCQIIMDGLQRGTPGSPVAQKTSLGWILSGQLEQTMRQQITINNFHVITKLDEQLKQFWEVEEVPTRKEFSEEEQQCEEIFATTHKRLSTGRYEVHLPFRERAADCVLGKSRAIALCRMHQMENKFRRNPVLKDKYAKCLEEYTTLNHMVKVNTTEEHHQISKDGMSSYTCSYLPHHCVIKESSTTTKLRVVFDASRKTQSGISLNEVLMKGPVIQDDLAALLLRWRKYKVAFTADIEKMYRQIQVMEQHTQFQRIIWREHESKPLEDYKLMTVTFGTKSAPYLATRVLKQLAIDEKERFPIGSRLTLSDFYVDDLLSSTDTVESAKEARDQLINLMKSGGFELRKWASNSNELLETLPESHREIILPLSVDKDETIRTLGIHWNPHTDCFTYMVTTCKDVPIWTKRTILSEVAKLYDPLGWLAPIIMVAKILIQRLWLSGLDWDDKVIPELEHEWYQFRRNMKEIETIQINRWIHRTTSTQELEIHGFADASMKGYAAVVYACTTDQNGERHVSLLSAKTKVSPIKTISLPRLELCAASLLAKLLNQVVRSMDISKTTPIYAWTDSEIVIAWIKAHPSKWTTFVSNRVSQIHELLGQSIWNHVPSKDNPADCASRGMLPTGLRQHKLWWIGPDWLWKSKNYWPAKQEQIPTTLEQRKSTSVNIANIVVDELETKYSSFTKLLRVTAYCFRFIENLKTPKKSKAKGNQPKYLTSIELQSALQFWIQKTQQKYFRDEIKSLKRNQSVQRNSRLIKLYPFLDENEIIRVGGRLTNSELSYNEKHPIVLPDKGPLINLLIGKVHRDTCHGGPALMIATLTKKYWLLNARNAIRHEIHKCMPCFKQRAGCLTQLMGDLPQVRVTHRRPFAHTGVDYCGPFELKTYKGRSHKKYKAYIAVFICMSVKAIHLEVVTDMTTEGFIAAYRRFCARRGACSDLYTDCGSNFIGAQKVLTRQQKQQIQQLDNEIAEILETEGVRFHFIPPSSPHFGGLWESGVRSTKHHLKRVLRNTVLTYEEFTTVLTQIEACLNSRPLCEQSRDPRDLIPLTPGHFLIGDSLLTPAEPSVLNTNDNRLQRWQFVQKLYQNYWKRWNAEYLCRLQQRPKWTSKTANIAIGDLVILKEDNLPPSRWALARIIETHPGDDGLVRVVTLKTKTATLKRPIAKICALPFTNKTDTPIDTNQTIQ